jgi:tRNA uridine 5-carboxymethylaminomethyl modification enzyme
LHLRIDNADRRLTPHGRRVGLISDEAWAEFEAKQRRLDEVKLVLERTKVTGAIAEEIAVELRSTGQPRAAVPTCSVAIDLASAVGQPLAQLLRRPEITIERLAAVLRELMPRFFDRDSSSEIRNELKSVETEIKYAGYLDQQQRAIDRLKKAEQRRIPDWFDYRAVSGLSREMQEKLGNVIPQTIGQASRIPGVTPAAVSLINVYIEIQGRRREQAATL